MGGAGKNAVCVIGVPMLRAILISPDRGLAEQLAAAVAQNNQVGIARAEVGYDLHRGGGDDVVVGSVKGHRAVGAAGHDRALAAGGDQLGEGLPLVFLAPTFMPRAQLQGWLQVAASLNPTTYVLETMRGVLIGGWNPGQLASGFAVIGALCIAATLWATRVARRTTSRR